MWRFMKGFFRGIWRAVSGFNKLVMTLIPLAITLYLVVIVVVAVRQVQPEPIPEQAALLINPVGVLVENRSPLEPLDALTQGGSEETLIYSINRAIREAADDSRITALVFDLQALNGPSVSHVLNAVSASSDRRFNSSVKNTNGVVNTVIFSCASDKNLVRSPSVVS